jgi:ATP-binding cassette subfamily B protein
LYYEGQRTRLGLARAVYSFNRDVFVWDDPFSSLDPKVARTIWERVVKGLLRDYNRRATLVLSTYLPKFLEQCDQVLLFHGGILANSDTHQNLLKTSTHYSQLLHSQQGAEHDIP